MNDKALLEAAKQLVYLKDMKDRLTRLHEMGHGTDWDYYHKNKAPAWDALRSAIAAAQAEPQRCPHGMLLTMKCHDCDAEFKSELSALAAMPSERISMSFGEYLSLRKLASAKEKK